MTRTAVNLKTVNIEKYIKKMASSVIQKRAALHLDPREWVHIGETAWDEIGGENLQSPRLISGWVRSLSTSDNSITIVPIKNDTRKRNAAKRTDEAETFVLKSLMPPLTATEVELDTVLKIGVCLKTKKSAPGAPKRRKVNLVQISIFINKVAVMTSWNRWKTIPCYGDVFRLLDFFYVIALEDGRDAPELSTGSEIATWIRRQEIEPPVFTSLPYPGLYRIGDTGIIIDVDQHKLYDEELKIPAIECSGGAFIGPPGVGKFSSFIKYFKTCLTTSKQKLRTHCSATLIFVPSCGIAWRLSQLKKHGVSDVVVVACKQDLVKTTWKQLLSAKFIVVSVQFINSKAYMQHLNAVTDTLSHHPMRGYAVRTEFPPSQKRRRVSSQGRALLELDVGLENSEAFKVFDVDMKESSGTSAATSDELRYACACTRRVLDQSDLLWEMFTSPVLEVLSYDRVLYVDSDRYVGLINRMAVFEAASRWMTAAELNIKETLIILPEALHATQNTAARKNFVFRNMVSIIKSPTHTAAALKHHHVEVSMTPREALHTANGTLKLKPLMDTAVYNVNFVSKEDMYAQVMKAAQQHLDALTAKRELLQADIARAADENDDDDPFVEEAANEDEDEDADSDSDSDSSYEEKVDDGDGEEGVDFIDFQVTDEEGISALETFMLEFTAPERMQNNLKEVECQIQNFRTDEDGLKTRVRTVIDHSVGKDLCVICSCSSCNAVLACGHAFCVGCISTWRDSKSSCPTCNKPMATIVALDEFEAMPLPIPGSERLWSRVWKTQTLSSQMYWFVHVLGVVEATSRRALIIADTVAQARNLTTALATENVTCKQLLGSHKTRDKLMVAFANKLVHVVVLKADVLSGAGFPHVTDIVFAHSQTNATDKDKETRQQIVERFHTCENVYTYSSVRL